MYSLAPNGKAAVVVPTGFIAAQSGIERRIRAHLVDYRMLRGVVNMPSNIFATTGTNVSILFIDKSNKGGDIVLVDASKLGQQIKEGNNTKTLLSEDEENMIIRAFKNHEAVDDFSVLVGYEDISEKNYSFSAGQYFKINVQYSDIPPEEFKLKIAKFNDDIDRLFVESRMLEDSIKKQLVSIEYGEVE